MNTVTQKTPLNTNDTVPAKSAEALLREQLNFGSVFTIPRPPVLGKTAWRTR